MAQKPPVRVIRKSEEGGSAARIARQRALLAEHRNGKPGALPGGIGFNGDLVQTPNGPVWVPHGEAPPANALEMRAGAGSVGNSGMSQPQLDPNTNLYQYRQRASEPGRPVTPDTPAPFDFPGTYSANPEPTPIVAGYNGLPPPPTNPFAGGMGPQPPPPQGAQPPLDPTRPPTSDEPFPTGPGAPGSPTNPFNPNMGPQPPLALPQQPPQNGQLQGLLAAYGYTTGPNGELLPIHLRQGNSPFQNAPGQSQVPGYQVPGYP